MKMTAPLEIGICCADLDSLRDFYIDVLGCAPVSDLQVSPDKAVAAGMAEDGYRVARIQTPWGERLKLIQPIRAAETDAPDPWILARRGIAYITFIVDDLEGMINRLKKAGAAFLSGEAPVEVRPGTYLSFIRDPEGNVLEFVEYGNVGDYRSDLAR